MVLLLILAGCLAIVLRKAHKAKERAVARREAAQWREARRFAARMGHPR